MSGSDYICVPGKIVLPKSLFLRLICEEERWYLYYTITHAQHTASAPSSTRAYIQLNKVEAASVELQLMAQK